MTKPLSSPASGHSECYDREYSIDSEGNIGVKEYLIDFNGLIQTIERWGIDYETFRKFLERPMFIHEQHRSILDRADDSDHFDLSANSMNSPYEDSIDLLFKIIEVSLRAWREERVRESLNSFLDLIRSCNRIFVYHMTSDASVRFSQIELY